jgi:hypothetical protein
VVVREWLLFPKYLPPFIGSSVSSAHASRPTEKEDVESYLPFATMLSMTLNML